MKKGKLIKKCLPAYRHAPKIFESPQFFTDLRKVFERNSTSDKKRCPHFTLRVAVAGTTGEKHN